MRSAELRLLKNCEEDTYQNIKDRNSINIENPNEEELANKNNVKLEEKSKKKYILIGIILLLIFISIVSGIVIYLLSFRKIEEKYSQEDLVVDINYNPGMIYRYNLRKTTEMKINGNIINKGNNSRNIEQIADFFFMIKQENIEKNIKNLTSKKWFSGYLSLLNISIINEKDIIQIVNDKILDNILNNRDKRIYPNENISFVKIDFYENGEIKNIYYPNRNFSFSNMEYIREYIYLIIPKISSNLYTNNITKELNELIEKDNNNKYFRRLKEGKEKELYSLIKKKIYKFKSNQSEEFEIEEFLIPPGEESFNYDLREKNNNTNSKNINLTEFSIENIENTEVNLKNSMLNKTISTSINDEGFLESVTEKESALIINEKNEEKNIEDYKTNITFDIDEMYFETITQLTLSNNFIDENLNNILHEYFDSYSYILFNDTYYNEYIKKNILNRNNLTNNGTVPEVTEINDKNLRRISSNSNTYYGMSKIMNEKDLYNYNFLGLTMKKTIFNEVDPFTGKITSYFNMIFGNINRKIKTSEQQTNLNIILEKKNKMAFNLIQLLQKSNLELKNRNKNISEIIINLENNILKLFKDYDYSNIFDEHLKQVSDQLNSFTGELFNKLINLINVIYENYTKILDDIKHDKYDVFIKIRKETKKEYINYIYQMINNLEKFSNTTLLFLEKIEDEVNKLNKIEKIDILYDILDNIYEGKLLFEQFNKDLFKAIEKGIITFKTDINLFKEEIIGDLLYITDFLSINIVKNEIIIRAYDAQTLYSLSVKLKNFRNIIQLILDLLIDNINNDYDYELSLNNNSLKKYSFSKAQEFLNTIDIKSIDITNKIKDKINYHQLYEIYTSNLDYIDFINNKTIIEFINNMNNQFFKKVINLQPEYLQNNISQNQNNSILLYFDQSLEEKTIKNNINENKDKINEKYFHNLTYEFFINETNLLFNELQSVFDYNIEIHKKVIDENYHLGIDYINELYSQIIGEHKGNAAIGNGFYAKYQKFIIKYNEYISLAKSDESFENIKQIFNKVKIETLNLVKNKFNSKENKVIKDFILSLISEQIDKYFDNKRIIIFKNKMFVSTFNELEKYNEIKINEFIELFEYIYNNSKGFYSTDSDYEYDYKTLSGYIIIKADNWLTTTNNIEKVNLDLFNISDFINNKLKDIFSNYERKINDYLPYYINYIEMLYNNISFNNSNIYYKKDKLFNISQKITEEINKEINEINYFSKNYINKFKNENLYDIYCDLDKINNLFSSNEAYSLFNEFKEAFNYTIEMHKDRIDYNYELGFGYVEDLHDHIFRIHAGDNLNLGRGGYEKYWKFRTMTEEYVYLANSEEIYNNLEKNYLKIQSIIFNFLKNKLSTIENFNFENYEENLDFIKRINNEIYSINERFNKYFSKERFEFLKAEFMQYSLNELTEYNKIYNKTFVDKYEYIKNYINTYIYNTKADYRYWFRLWHGGKRNRPNNWVGRTNFIYSVDININHTLDYMNNITDLIIEKFIIRIDDYLCKYINNIQTLYNNLYSYIINKINDHSNLKDLFLDYEIIFNKTLIYNSNNGLFKKLFLEINNEKEIYINNLENNVNLLSNEYFNSFYLKSYDKFLEYPNEIIYKINQFRNELDGNIYKIKEKINNIYLKRIQNIINSTNIFIQNLLESNYKYILIYINKNIPNEYLSSKFDFISNNFKHYSNLLENKSLNIIYEKNIILDDKNFNIHLSNISEKLDIFISNLQSLININFTSEQCYNISYTDQFNLFDSYDNYTNKTNNTDISDSICEKIQYKSNLSNYEYNYNVLKLRSGLYYTKKALENIMNLYDDLNYDNLLNIEQYNNLDNSLNDKNILDIYNLTLSKLKEIKENSNSLLKEQHDLFYNEIKDIYLINNDYYPFLQEIESILKYENKQYNEFIINYINNKFNFVDSILFEFNKTLFEQKNEYQMYNIDENNTFLEIFKEYQTKISEIFENIIKEILNLNESTNFINGLRKHLFYEQHKKILYFKTFIDEISTNYNFNLLNMTLNIGEIIENLLIKEYESLEFNSNYKYMKIYNQYLNNYLERISTYISEIRNNMKDKLQMIYDIFLEKFYIDTLSFIDEQYIIEYKQNFSICLNYSIESLNNYKKEDEINFKKYLDYLNKMNDSTLNISEIEKVNFTNKTEILLDCYNNNYYNYTINLFKNFDQKYKNKLDYLINKTNSIDINNFCKNLLNEYFEKYYKLENYTQTKEVFDDIYYKLFLAYDDTILYINYTQNKIYYDYLYNLLVNHFKSSYINYIDNYLISSIIDNITLFINNNAEINLYYLLNKLTDEYNYYIMILSNTEEFGISTAESLSNLYDDVNKKINQSISYTINEYVLFYIDNFFKNNKHIFRDNYIKYYKYEKNVYNIEIYQLKENLDEFIYNGGFNKTLNEYSDEIMSNHIIDKLNNTINDLLHNKLYQIYSIINDFKKEINILLSNITIIEEEENINNIINSYKIILFNQNNQFLFKVSDIPFELLDNFITNILAPPISEIKVQYYSIEEKILEKVLKIINSFPDFNKIIKENLAIYDIFESISLLSEKIPDLLLKYQDELNDDYDTYINKLIHYTYINGLDTYDEPCNYSFCSINISDFKNRSNISRNENKRNLRETNEKKEFIYMKFKDYKILNVTKANELESKKPELYRKLSENKEDYYDETMNSVTKEDVINYLLNIRNTIYEFNKTYINNFDINANLKCDKYIAKINGTYKSMLKNSILKSASKFSSILSRESYKKLLDNLLNQYYILDEYLNNNTYNLKIEMSRLITVLTNTSLYIGIINDLSFDKVLGYFDILTEMIQDKYKIINSNKNIKSVFENFSEKKEEEDDDDEPEGPNEIDEEKIKEFNDKYNNIKEKNKLFFSEFIGEIEIANKNAKGLLTNICENKKYDIEFDELEVSKILYKNKLPKVGYSESIDLFKYDIDLPAFILLFPSFPILQLRIVPGIDFSLNFEMGFEIDLLKDDYSVYFEISGEAEVSVSLEVGCYVPIFNPAVEISLSVGIKGVLGSGKVGVKLTLFINEPKYEIEKYYEYNALSLNFYSLFKVKVNMGIIKFSFQFYLINKKLINGFSGKKSQKKEYNYQKLK